MPGQGDDTGTSSIIELDRAFVCHYGAPMISAVERSIFYKQYATHCLACTFCNDLCCSHGVDVDFLHRDNMLDRAEALEAFTGIRRTRWFLERVIRDPELPGGGSVRTRVDGEGCVFLNPMGRGCQIHAFCAEMGIDYHELKSFVDCLFPLTVTDAVLCPADEVDDLTLVCVGRGPTLFEGLREELAFYFGAPLLECLRRIEERVRTVA